MREASAQLEKLRSIVEPICLAHGVSLVDARMTTEHGAVLRVMIERPGDDERVTVSLADCQNVSRDLSTALDVAEGGGLPSGKYRLEVSSPGVERPLVTRTDFERFVGREARVQSFQPIDGRRRFQGVLRGVVEDNVRIETGPEESFDVPLADITKANLVYRFENEKGPHKARAARAEGGNQQSRRVPNKAQR